jgi:NAD-dependent SIR2 family protein deacetylase
MPLRFREYELPQSDLCTVFSHPEGNIPDELLEKMADSMRRGGTAALTGAGISTESGIPDYRGPESSKRKRTPVLYGEFVSDPLARKRYWVRSAVGWPRMRGSRPNPAHLALARMERAGHVSSVVTQNVDRLHQAAGSRKVLELHGALAEVSCLSCGSMEPRDSVQQRILELNPWFEERSAEIAPDGDAEIDSTRLPGFEVAACLSCGGILKPNVVFFGERVPPARVEAAYDLIDRADTLLVLGSSLAVFSGYRFVKRAAAGGKPVFIVNMGPTRAAAETSLHINGPLGEVLPRLADLLG